MSFVKQIIVGLLMVLSVAVFSSLRAEDGLEITPSADFVSRYIWCGVIINEGPNIQPSIAIGVRGFELGLWGSSTLAKTNTSDDYYIFSHEVDFWAGYRYQFKTGMAIGIVLTDYYFPNASIGLGNFNNYDNINGAGAHTLETGFTFSGPKTFPINFSAYMNVHNDEGKNTYFQVDYSTELKTLGLDFFVGAAGGSDKNPGYYGTDGFKVINLGFTVNKSIKFSDSFSLPFFVTYVLNPKAEVNYLICGFSL